MLGSLIFAPRLSAAAACPRGQAVIPLEIRLYPAAAYSLTTRAMVRYCVGAMPT
jgi:hypothetical protein